MAITERRPQHTAQCPKSHEPFLTQLPSRTAHLAPRMPSEATGRSGEFVDRYELSVADDRRAVHRLAYVVMPTAEVVLVHQK